MTYVFHGIGTWYYGKSNVTTRRDTCAFCGKVSDISSYNTTKFVVFLFVPLIPLGATRVVNACRKCRHHQFMPLKAWEARRQTDLSAAFAAHAAKPDDVNAAIRAIVVTMMFEAKDEFLNLSRSFSPQLAQSDKFLAALGDAYRFFDMRSEAQAALHASLKIAPDPTRSSVLAAVYIYDGQVDRARPIIDSLLKSGERAALPAAGLCIEAYQSEGRHADAISLLNQSEKVFPDIVTDPAVAKYRATSTKHLATAKRIRSDRLTIGRVERPGFNTRLVPMAVIALLLIGFITWYFASAVYRGSHRSVYLLNGTEKFYGIKIDGEPYSLTPYTPRQIDIAEGDHTITFEDGSLPARSFSLNTSFWSRPFTEPTFIVNPDSLAVMRHETIEYVQFGTSSQPVITMQPPAVLHTLGHVDYLFCTPPSTLMLKRGANAKRTVLTVWQEQRLELRTYLVRFEFGEAAAHAYTLSAIALAPDDEAAYTGLAFVSPEQAQAALEPLLARRPVLVHAHRYYQSLMRAGKNYDAQIAKYAEMSRAEPTNSTLLYLAARVLAPGDDSTRLYERAASAPKPEPLAFRALAFDAMHRADFAGVVAIAERAGTKNFEKVDHILTHYHIHALWALGKPDAALAVAMSSRVDPQNILVRHDRTLLHVAVGKLDALARLRQSDPDYQSESIAEAGVYRRIIDHLVIEFAATDPAKAVPDDPAAEPAIRFADALWRGDFTIARETIGFLSDSAPQSAHPIDHLNYFIAAAAHNKPDESKWAIERLLERYLNGPVELRQLAKLLTTDGAAALDLVRNSAFEPDQLAQIYYMIGHLNPPVRAEAHTRARAFAYGPMYAHKHIRRMLAKP